RCSRSERRQGGPGAEPRPERARWRTAGRRPATTPWRTARIRTTTATSTRRTTREDRPGGSLGSPPMSGAVRGEGLVGLPEIEAAARRLQGVAVATPLLRSDVVSEAVGAQVRLKCESLQRAGSFKIRGAYNFVSQLSDEQVAQGIITYSSGNHAQAVALAGRLRGIRSVVVMPTTSPGVKRAGAERLGAEVVIEGTTSIERKARAEQIASEEGLAMVPPFDHRHIIAGQGTVGYEIARAWPDVDVVLVPIGGGGLASGVAAAVKRMLPHARVVGVEPEGAASMRAALDAGKPIRLEHIDTIADGLAPIV